MIQRIWTARSTRDLTPRYLDYFRSRVLPELRAVAGFSGARVLVREASGGDREIVVQTSWKSLDAVKAFAGDRIEVAVVHEAAAALLSDYDRSVTHYEVAIDEH